MKKLCLLSFLIFIIGNACKKNDVVSNPVQTLQLNYGEEKQISVLNSNGSPTLLTIKCTNIIENRCTPSACKSSYNPECYYFNRPVTAYLLIKNNDKSDTLSLRKQGCLGDEDLTLNNDIIDKKRLNGTLIGLSNTTPFKDNNNLPVQQYFIKLLIQQL